MEPGNEPAQQPEYASRPQLEPELDWGKAASGLDLHRGAVVFRLIVVIVAVIYTCIQFSAHSDATVGGFALLLGGAELVTTMVALAGLWKLRAHVPRDIAGGISLATLCLFGVIVAELWSLWFLWRVVQLTSSAAHSTGMWDAPSIGDIMEQAKHAPYVQAASGIGALLAVLLVLGGIRRIAASLNDPGVVRHAATITGMVVALGAAYGLMQYLMTSTRVGGSALLVVLCIAIYGLVVLFGYLGVLRGAAEAMRAGVQTTLPVAELRRDSTTS